MGLLRYDDKTYFAYATVILRAAFPTKKPCGVQKCHFGRTNVVEKTFRSQSRRNYVSKISKRYEQKFNIKTKLTTKRKSNNGEKNNGGQSTKENNTDTKNINQKSASNILSDSKNEKNRMKIIGDDKKPEKIETTSKMEIDDGNSVCPI